MGAAFFDLDRTLISRSSSLALAGPFRTRGLIRRRDLAKATVAQLVFARFGAGHSRVGQTADSAMSILRGLPVTTMREIAAEAWEPVLKPLVYREALERADEHHERGESVYIASAALQEVVEVISSNLGFEGAIASRAEVRDGAYTGRLERRLYRGAAAITATTEAFVRAIERRGGAGKTVLLRNGTTARYLEAGEQPVDAAALGDPGGRFTWAYAGNLGLAQGLETAIEAASILGERFRLVLVGEGPRREALRELAARVPSGSVEIRDPVPPEEAARMLRAADALLVSLAPGFEGFIPSKLFDCCAVARPVVLAVGGEAAELAGASGAAICVPPGDPAALANAVQELAGDASLREELATRGRAFAEGNSRERGVETLESILEGVVATWAQERSRP